MVYTVKAEGAKGTQYEDKPFETNGDVWWCDIPTHLLGKPGDKVWIWALTEVGGRDARGITPQQWKNKSGGTWNFNGGSNRSGVAAWELACHHHVAGVVRRAELTPFPPYLHASECCRITFIVVGASLLRRDENDGVS
nr:hypothetical protein CFP56_02946 [Quercus suber]